MTRSTSSGWCGPPLPSGRKTLVNGLHAAFGDKLTKEQLANILVDCGLPADVRGERLGIAEFAGISRKIRQTQG